MFGQQSPSNFVSRTAVHFSISTLPKIYPMKKPSLLFPLILLLVLNIPFSFARTKVNSYLYAVSPASRGNSRIDEDLTYDRLSLQMKGLSKVAFLYAIKGFEQLLDNGLVTNDSLLTIVDLSQPSSHKRLYVIDTRNCRILFHSLVAHGRNSGTAMANRFSNKNE